MLVTCGRPGLSGFIRDRISTCSGTSGRAPGRNSFISPQRCNTFRAVCSSISASSSGDRWFFFSRPDDDDNNNNSTAVRADEDISADGAEVVGRSGELVALVLPSGTASVGILKILLSTLTSDILYSGDGMLFFLQSSPRMVDGLLASRHLL